MANFIVSPYAISYNSIKTALEAYINDKSASEVLDTWKDFYTAGAGQTILELDAAIASFYAFHFILGRREAYLPVAENYQSILGGAESLGYNASRGQNLHISIIFTPETSQALKKWDVVGSYAEYEIIVWEDALLNAGEEISLHCVIGNSAAQSIRITTPEIQQFTFTAEDTTDDCRLILTDREVPVSVELKDATEDNYIMLSNSYGSVDVFYLNKGQYNYSTQDILYLQYIQRNTLKYSQISESGISLDYGEITNIDLISDRKDKQSKQSIKSAAPIYHETNNVVRARKDYCKYLLQEGELNLLDTNDKDINPGLIALSYVKEKDIDGNNLLTEDQKKAFIEKMMKVCPDGVAEAFIEDPKPVIRTVNITLWKNTGEVLPANINDYIEEILDKYRNKLAVVLDLEAIEKELEKIPGVKIARVDLGASEYATNTIYKPYDVVTVKDILVGDQYETWKMVNSRIITKASSYEPDWGSAPYVGETVKDNNLLWQRTDNYINAVPKKWEQNGEYNIYDNIYVGYTIYPNRTSYTYPEWDTTVVVDGNVTFNRIKTYNYVLRNWNDHTQYELDEYVLFTNSAGNAVYKVREVLSKSGSAIPDWNSCEEINDTLQDNAITWRMDYIGFDALNSYNPMDKIAFVDGNKAYIYVCLNPCDKDTIYANTRKTASEQIPFNGFQEIKEWIQVDTNANDPEADANLVWTQGNVIWFLENIIEDLSLWTANTEIPLFSYIQANNNIFYAIDISNCTTGNVKWFENLTSWPAQYIDNNIFWEIDKVLVGDTFYNATGTDWHPDTSYSVEDRVIINSDSTLIYMVTYTNNEIITADNIAYTVKNYCGTTGQTSPVWSYEDDNQTKYYDNVIDNNILWTKVDTPSKTRWNANTTMLLGIIVNIDNDKAYYVFSTLLGTSGEVQPNWTGIRNNAVIDNNITWTRLGNTTKISLAWNEYLELSYTLTLN